MFSCLRVRINKKKIMSRATELLRSIPPATLSIMLVCCSVYLYQVVMSPNVQDFTMNPRLIIYFHEYYRLVTSTLFHGSALHIGMNMMSTLAISSLLEKQFGTLRHGLTILWAILWTTLTYSTIACLLYVLFGMEGLMYQHALGFSGVIFHLSVLESNLTPHRSRSLFGFVSVPSVAYPWALLVFLQIVMPNLSFMGHLAGILTGTLQLYGFFDFAVPSESYLQKIETLNSLGPLVSFPTFVTTPISLGDASSSNGQRDPSALGRAIYQGLGTAANFVRDVAETIKVILFGRGREANANVQLPSLGRAQPVDTLDDFEDDDWVGLPAPRSSMV